MRKLLLVCLCAVILLVMTMIFAVPGIVMTRAVAPEKSALVPSLDMAQNYLGSQHQIYAVRTMTATEATNEMIIVYLAHNSPAVQLATNDLIISIQSKSAQDKALLTITGKRAILFARHNGKIYETRISVIIASMAKRAPYNGKNVSTVLRL